MKLEPLTIWHTTLRLAEEVTQMLLRTSKTNEATIDEEPHRGTLRLILMKE